MCKYVLYGDAAARILPGRALKKKTPLRIDFFSILTSLGVSVPNLVAF